jgi:PAS domain-containing protein
MRQESSIPDAPLPIQAGLDDLVQGVSIFDGELRLVAWNRRFVELLEIPPRAGAPGGALRRSGPLPRRARRARPG